MPYFGHFILHYIVQLFGAGYKSYARVFCIFLGKLERPSPHNQKPPGAYPRGHLFEYSKEVFRKTLFYGKVIEEFVVFEELNA